MDMSVQNVLVWNEEEHLGGKWMAASGLRPEAEGDSFHYVVIGNPEDAHSFSLLMTSDELGVDTDEAYASLKDAKAECQRHEDTITRLQRIQEVFGLIVQELGKDIEAWLGCNLKDVIPSDYDRWFDAESQGTLRVGHLVRAYRLLEQLKKEIT